VLLDDKLVANKTKCHFAHVSFDYSGNSVL